MYSSLPGLVRGWSRILYDAAGRRVLPLLANVLDPLIFSQPAHVALAAALILLAIGAPGPFPAWLLGLSVRITSLAASVLYRLYRVSVSDPRSVVWYPLAGLVNDWILFKAIAMCLTGRVTWRGTAYRPPSPSTGAGPALSTAARPDP